MMRLQDGSDPIWGPFIYDGDESESIKSLQEHLHLITSNEEEEDNPAPEILE